MAPASDLTSPTSLVTIDPATPVDWGLPAKFKSWRPGQFKVIMQAVDTDKRFFALCSPTGCVAGDTIIGINRNGNGGSMRIDEAYQQSQRFSATWKIRSLKEDLNWVGSHSVRQFVYSGKRLTWLLVLANGRSIRATPDHKVLTINGWKRLDKLTSQDSVICEQRLLPYGLRPKKGKAIYRQVQGLLYHKYAGGAASYRTRPCRPGGKLQEPEGRLYRVAKHRLVYEAHINDLSFDEFVRICRTDKKRARSLIFLDPSKISVHHKDEDYSNNDLDNLVQLSLTDHSREHGIKSAFKHFGVGFTEAVPVWKVMPFQVEDTYDVVCADPYHNFVGNGIVVHNSGKSLNYTSVAVITGLRTVILVITKALQDQLLRDFASIGMVDIRGAANYSCLMSSPAEGPMTCEEGTHAKCRYSKTPRCPRTLAYEAAINASLVVTNYHYWCLINLHGKGLGKVDLLVLDEAHGAPEALAGIVESEITDRMVKMVGLRWPSGDLNMGIWRAWAASALETVAKRIEEAKGRAEESVRPSTRSIREMLKLSNLSRMLRMVAESTGDWEWEQSKFGFRFAPLWPRQFAESHLFRDIARVMLISATVRPKTLDLLGIGTDQFQFVETTSTFPVARMPVYWLPTIACKYTNTDQELRTLYRRIDRILESRSDRKALIHSVSYKRQNEIVVGCASNAGRMSAPKSNELTSAITSHKRKPDRSPAPVLISPAITTGYDFPYTDAEVNIIPKLPFPDSRSKIQKARQDADPEYASYQMMQVLVQMCGRASRAEDDASETIILDDQISWAIKKFKKFVPGWFYKYSPYNGKQTGGVYTEIPRRFAGEVPPLPPVPPKLVDPRSTEERNMMTDQEIEDDSIPF